MSDKNDLFAHDAAQVIGVHAVFEHHEAMRAASLKAFLHEFRVTFPAGIDRPPLTGGVPTGGVPGMVARCHGGTVVRMRRPA